MSVMSSQMLLTIKQSGRPECAERARAAVECDYASPHATTRHRSRELYRHMKNGSLNGDYCSSHASGERIGVPCGRSRRGSSSSCRVVERQVLERHHHCHLSAT